MGVINTTVDWYKILKVSHSGKEHIADLQQKRLRRILRYAVGNSEFYQNLYRGIDIENCDLQDLPVVTKAAMMDNYDHFVTDKRLKLHEIQSWVKDKQNDGKFYLGEFSPFMTSGSSGVNALITYHREAVEVIQASLLANYPFLTKRSIKDHIKTIVGYLFGKKPRVAVILVSRGNIYQFFDRIPTYHRLFMSMKALSLLDPLDQIVKELNKFQPDQLISNAFFIALLAQEQLAGRLKLAFKHPMAFIAGFGEVLSEHTQELASKAWNMKIQDTYGAMECYLMATSCSMYGHLHVMSHLCIIEIVDRKYKPIPPGQYGEKILLTNLFNFTQPIIRYEIDDVTGYANQSCECGSPLPTLLPVQGRTIDFFYFKNPQGGYDQLPPNVLIISLMYLHEVRQYQIVQTARNELTFIYVPQDKALNIEQKLKQALTEALAQRGLEDHVLLRFKQVESISRHERSGKYKPIISLGAPNGLDAP
jgi:putative adenylate-forming enzyme